MRRAIPWVLLGTLLSCSVGAAVLGGTWQSATATSKANTRDLVSPYFLEGQLLALAQSLARSEGVRLHVVYVPSAKPKGQVVGQDPNFGKDETVAVSTGPLHNRFAVLAPAKVRPVTAECAGGLQFYEDGTVGPLWCQGGVNFAAWRSYETFPVLGLGRQATADEVARALCSDTPTVQAADNAYQLASKYYGWTFGMMFATDYLVGLHGRSCAEVLRGSS